MNAIAGRGTDFAIAFQEDETETFAHLALHLSYEGAHVGLVCAQLAHHRVHAADLGRRSRPADAGAGVRGTLRHQVALPSRLPSYQRSSRVRERNAAWPPNIMPNHCRINWPPEFIR